MTPRECLWARTLTLKLKTASFRIITRSKTLSMYIQSAQDIYRVASKLLLRECPIRIRLLGIRMSNFKGVMPSLHRGQTLLDSSLFRKDKENEKKGAQNSMTALAVTSSRRKDKNASSFVSTSQRDTTRPPKRQKTLLHMLNRTTQPSSTTTSVSSSWICAQCTFINKNKEFLACAVCCAPRRFQGEKVDESIVGSQHEKTRMTVASEQRDESTRANAFTMLMGKRQRLAPAHPGLSGCHVFEHFLTEKEERELLDDLDRCSPHWSFSSWNGSCFSKTWGVEVDVVKRCVGPVKRPIPSFLNPYVARMTSGEYLPLAGFVPNECNSNSYIKKDGHWLRAHVDDRQLSGELLANLSLGCDCDMLYTHEKSGRKISVRLPRRCLQVVSGDARYNWTHEIRKDDLFGPRRVSVTFRGNGQTKGSRRAPPVGIPEHRQYTL